MMDMVGFANGVLAGQRFAPPPAAAHIPHYKYLCIDIETGDASPDAADRWMRSCWRPDALGTWKFETVAKRLQEMYFSKKEKLALLEEAPVKLIVLKSDCEFRLLHCLEASAPAIVEGATVQGFATEKEMLLALRMLMNTAVVMPDAQPATTAAPTELVCHNGLSFDFPKLRTRMVANRIQLPRCLVGEVPIFDTMRVFGRRFGCLSDPFIGMDAICEIFGLPQHKHLVSGAEIPKLIAAGEFEKVITYTLLDGLDTEQLYLFMTGQHPECT